MIAREWQWAIWDPVARHGDGEGHIRTGCGGGCRMVDEWLCSVNAGGSAVHINVTTYFVLYRYVTPLPPRRGASPPLNKDPKPNERAVKARSRARDTHSPDTSEHSDLIRNRIRISRWPVRRSGGSNSPGGARARDARGGDGRARATAAANKTPERSGRGSTEGHGRGVSTVSRPCSMVSIRSLSSKSGGGIHVPEVMKNIFNVTRRNVTRV